MHRIRHRSASPQYRRFLACVAISVLTLVASSAQAHVGLLFPNGGEVFDAGSTVTVLWEDVISHGVANYDLWYSLNGGDEPWIEIASNLRFPDPGRYNFDWTLPNTPSDNVRVRVRQNTGNLGYEDISDGSFRIVAVQSEETMVLEPVFDATLYEGDGSLANGSGSYLFTGRTQAANGSAERRALLDFDIAGAIPAGSIVTGVSLELTMSRTISGNLTVGLHRILEAWSEGSSDPGGEEGGGASSNDGDSTWVHRLYPDVLWTNEGGTFVQLASANLDVSDTGDYAVSSTNDMVADVQLWLDDAASNHGWALVALQPSSGSAKRFNSKEHETVSSRPRLSVTFEPNLEAPSAAFDFSPESPMVGQEVHFEDQSSGFPNAWSWDFGDGQNSDEKNPSHVYSGDGVFEVRLIASNHNGSDTSTMEITVLPAEEPELEELVFLPAAANIAGEGGSFFVTTVDVHNAGSSPAMYRLLFLPRDADNSEPLESGTFNLLPGASQRFHNLLLDTFDLESGAGAVIVQSNSADIEVMSRTFNQGGIGTVGQGIAGVAAEELIPAGTRARVLFLSENGDSRSNLGIVNGKRALLTLQWQLFDSRGTSLGFGEKTLPPWGNTQINRLFEAFAPIEAAYADVWTTTSGGAFTCYGSVLDETTGDPTTILPR